jgi:peroxiredoxin
VVDIEAAAYRGSPLSLVLFARSTCAACQRSADFHQQIVATGKALGVPTVLVTPSEDAAAEVAYAAGLGIAATQVHTVPAGSIKLRAVPALMVVDDSGRIRHVWFGAPDAASQTTILAAVTAVAGARVP